MQDAAQPSAIPEARQTTAAAATPAAPVTPLTEPSVVALLARSPMLSRALEDLRHDGVRVEWGTRGGGTFYDPAQSRTVIDAAASGDGTRIVRSLSHEIGHVQFHEPPQFGSRQAYVHHQLRNEATATLHNALVRNEIVAQGGPDIGISGANVTAYGRIASDATSGTISRDQALDRIANVFGQEHPSVAPNGAYVDYYGGYDVSSIVPWLRSTGQRPEPAQSPDARLRPDHPAAPLFDTLRARFPASVSDAHALDATLKAHAEGITARDAKGVVHEDRAWVMSTQLTGPRASSDLTTPPIALEESIQRSARSDATAAKQVEPTDAQIAPVAVQRHGP